MKCPKCGYLGFESSDRCRNCGYDFSLATAAPQSIHTGSLAKAAADIDFALDPGPDEGRPPLDLERIIGAPDGDGAADLPLFAPGQTDRSPRPSTMRRTGGVAAEDMPLITGPLRPRAPLGVRRATGEVPRARPRTVKPAAPQEETLFETPPVAVIGQGWESKTVASGSGESLAAPWRRVAAGLIDLTLVCAVDAVVLYLTLRLLGLTTSEMSSLPLLPIAAFFLLLNGGYFVAFTTVGGQSIGKMALGIKVISEEESTVPVGRATVRTLAYIVSALPLGAGFLPGVISADRLALHDRLAHTRVIRPSQT